MMQKHIDGYIHERKHDFDVDVNNAKNYSLKHTHLYVWVESHVPPEFTFITAKHIESGSKEPNSKIIIDNDGAMHLKHGHSRWFRPNGNDSEVCNAVNKAYEEWSIEEVLIGGSHEC